MSETASPVDASPPAEFRILWLDYVRGLNILIVVFVHVWRGLVGAGVTPNNPGVEHALDCTASMALFFFISGNFIARTIDLPFRVFLKEKLKDFAYPYIIWVTIHGVLHSFAGGHTNQEFRLVDLWTALYDPPWHYWFLYTLFVTQILYYGVHKLRIPSKWFVVFAILLSLTIDIPGLHFGPWGVFYQFRRYLLWFAFGVLINRGAPLKWLSNAPTSTLAVTVVLGFALAAWEVSLGARELQTTTLMLMIPSGIAQMSLAVLLERWKIFEVITLWGRRSLEIYLAHAIFLAALRILLQHKLGVENTAIHVFLGMVAGLYCPVFLYWICDRFNANYLFSLRKR